MSSPIKKTYTIEDVRLVPTYWIAVPISRIENLQIMRFLSTIFILVGGVCAGITYPFVFLGLGIFFIFIGLMLEGFMVHRVIRGWRESKLRCTIYTGSTIVDPSEYEQAEEQT